jgi:hypothetical protein
MNKVIQGLLIVLIGSLIGWAGITIVAVDKATALNSQRISAVERQMDRLASDVSTMIELQRAVRNNTDIIVDYIDKQNTGGRNAR